MPALARDAGGVGDVARRHGPFRPVSPAFGAQTSRGTFGKYTNDPVCVRPISRRETDLSTTRFKYFRGKSRACVLVLIQAFGRVFG